jgi:hypothetical protein
MAPDSRSRERFLPKMDFVYCILSIVNIILFPQLEREGYTEWWQRVQNPLGNTIR